jgi:hypothetical protein
VLPAVLRERAVAPNPTPAVRLQRRPDGAARGEVEGVLRNAAAADPELRELWQASEDERRVEPAPLSMRCC